MLALMPQFDADHNGALSPDEQARAVEDVRKTYGATWSEQISNMFGRAVAPDKSVTAARWEKEVAAFGKLPAKQTERVAMRDGVHLATDVFLPAGAAPSLVRRLHAAVDATIRSPDVARKFTELGADPQFGTPTEFAAYVAADLEKWAALARQAGLKVE